MEEVVSSIFNALYLLRQDRNNAEAKLIAVLQQLERAPTETIRDAAGDLLREGHGFASRPGENLMFRRDREQLRDQIIELLESRTNEPNEQ